MISSRSPELAALVHEAYERALAPEEFERRVAEIIADREEKANIAELIAWFTRRYPTVEARLRYARKHARSITR